MRLHGVFSSVFWGMAISAMGGRGLAGADCNGNGIEDSLDLLANVQYEASDSSAAGTRLQPSLAAADLDGDGDVDLASVIAGSPAEGTPSTVEIRRNDGNGRFTTSTIDSGADVDARAIQARDLDLDGDSDLVTGNRRGGISIYLNAGNAGFAPPTGYFSSVRQSSTNVEILTAPLDGDADVDVVLITGRQLTVFLNNGLARFDFSSTFEPGASALGSVAAADMNDDGIHDLVAVINGEITVLLNDGRARFTGHKISDQAGTGLTPADLDGDGDADLVFTGIYVGALLNYGDLSFPFVAYFSRESFPNSVQVLDVDRDGDLDIAAGLLAEDSTPRGMLLTLLNDGSAAFSPAQDVFTLDGGLEVREPADFDGDGATDLAVESFDISKDAPTLVVLYNNTQPAASTDRDANGVPDECENPEGFHRGDANGDGNANITDAIHILDYLFGQSPAAISCEAAADANDDGGLNLSDSIYILNFLFSGGAEPLPPGIGGPCGPDPTPDAGSPRCNYKSCR